MTAPRRALVALVAWIVAISSAHAALNVNWKVLANDWIAKEKRRLNVAYIPVTCHLACPVQRLGMSRSTKRSTKRRCGE